MNRVWDSVNFLKTILSPPAGYRKRQRLQQNEWYDNANGNSHAPQEPSQVLFLVSSSLTLAKMLIFLAKNQPQIQNHSLPPQQPITSPVEPNLMISQPSIASSANELPRTSSTSAIVSVYIPEITAPKRAADRDTSVTSLHLKLIIFL